MPHLSKLQAKYADKVTVLALSDESVKLVGSFLEKTSVYDGKTWSEAMDYTVATDADGSVKRDIFTAAGMKGIPSSFIIADGVIQWIGHPGGLDKPLAEVVAGRWDVNAAKADAAEEHAFQHALKSVNPKLRQLKNKPEQLLEVVQELAEQFPRRAEVQVKAFNILLLQLHRDDEAYAVARKLIAAHPDDANLHNGLAWTIVDNKAVQNRDLDLALSLAKRANELTESKDASVLDTLARTHFERGDIDKALSWQKKAVAKAQGRMAAELRKSLKRYEAAKAQPKKKSFFK